ncbi:hypothetical protein JYU34_013701 [Plutella xylostella]|uniref:Uncharacterized protein n=1 Tax=Plutella xylostella TaxID=51655 RepID=A0ABQ7QAE7_PLUXY|nr:hypothetical protein JYU34_013701 [Plutella xylostella]
MLNAFSRSTLKMTVSDPSLSKAKARVACMAASQPSGTPKPSCRGCNWADITPLTALQPSLATRRRSALPIAIGRIPPSFFINAHRDAPYKNGVTSLFTIPLSIKFAKLHIEPNRTAPLSPAPADVNFLRSSGRIPSKPGAEPLWKLPIA